MVAGRGVTHSERTSEQTRKAPHELFGIQTWLALPESAEDTAPSFEHVAKAELPIIEDGGASARLILGTAYGKRAPVKTFSEMFYLDVKLEPGASFPLPDDHEDRALYVLDGEIRVAGQVFGPLQMLVFRPGDRVSATAGTAGARLMLLGGETLNGPRHIFWNFVSSSKEKLEDAKAAWRAADWTNGPFHLPPGDDQEFVPLP